MLRAHEGGRVPVGHGLARAVVAGGRKGPEAGRVPAPALERLGGGLVEVGHGLGPVEMGVAAAAGQVVDDVAQLVEELSTRIEAWAFILLSCCLA